MCRSKFSLIAVMALTLAATTQNALLRGQSLNYPYARRTNQLDDYQGTKVADPAWSKISNA